VNDFDFESVFGDDYLHFYESVLTDEVSDRQVATLAGLVPVHPGMRVLDCPCGFGRIANRLAGLGAEVVGIDSGERFLEVARRAGLPVDYRLGDMRELDFDAEFDLIVNVFTSFGYYDDAADQAVLASFRRALKPGGRLVIDLQNSHRILSIISAAGGQSVALIERGDDLLVDRNRYDNASGRTLTERISVRGGKVLRYPFSVRLFAPAEISSWLRGAGFGEVGIFDQDGQPFTLAARRMWVVATA
jgi:SAM-dependent methyltransferase